MSKNPYNPSSHFFVDHNNLFSSDDPNHPGNEITDGFGPVSGNATNLYRTTSFTRATTTSKVFAICDGQVLIQPYDGDSTKVNLLLKPTTSYAPFKIKYFIYRGVNKEDLISGLNLVNQNSESPPFIKRIWQASIDLAESLEQPIPSNLEAFLIGYDPSMSDEELLDSLFFGGSSVDFNLYNIPKCFKGELLGNFTEKIGLDIVLDYGDYELDYEEKLFKFDLAYARKGEHIFDITTITGAVKQKRYREYIHQFIDAAAFWGSHIGRGEISLWNITNPVHNVDDIFPLVSKYFTKDKIYLYIQSERTRSYNFYGNYPIDNTHFELSSQIDNYKPYYFQNQIDNWPILIKNFPQSGTTIAGTIKIKLQNVFNVNVANVDRHRVSYIKVSNWDQDLFVESSFEIQIQNKNTSGSNYISLANLIRINHLGDEEMPLIPYYKNLFGPVNIKSLFSVPTNTNESFAVWSAYTQSRLINFDAINKFKNALVNTKVVLDKGKDSLGIIKERRLYISECIDLISSNSDYIRKSPISSFNKNYKDRFEFELYGNDNFKLYKGTIDDGNDINSLMLTNIENHELKKGIFQLGILEEEYNKLMYNSSTIPSPPSPTPHIPLDATNIYIYLDAYMPNGNPILENESFRKFNLGLEFENSAGILEKKFPSIDIEIYTIDGFFFFSENYSKYQDRYLSFSNTIANFRPHGVTDPSGNTITPWKGEFGFDWIRIHDTDIPGDTGVTFNASKRDYYKILGHYYTSSPKKKLEPNQEPPGSYSFEKEVVEWQSFQSLFKSYPTKLSSHNILENYSQYNVPFITLYPSLDENGIPTLFPKPSAFGFQKCFTMAFLNLKTHIESSSIPSSLKIRFESGFIDIISTDPLLTTLVPDLTDPIKYSCLEIINKSSGYRSIEVRLLALKEFKEDKLIQVLSIENGIERIAGALIVKANHKSLRREVKVLFVNVESDINGDSTSEIGFDYITSDTDEKIEETITPFFNQLLFDIVTLENKVLKLNNSAGQAFLNSYKDSSGNFHYDNPPQSFHLEIYNKFKATQDYQSKYEDYLKVFYFGFEDKKSTGDIIAGAAASDTVPKKMGVVCVFIDGILKSNGIDVMQTTAHELLHVVGLQHTFNSLNPYTFEQYITDNIMDYQKAGDSPPERVSISEYQKVIFSKNSKFTNEV